MENQFVINQFFNEHPIRIIGTPDEPAFYASDIGDILGIKQVSVSIKNFDETEIVMPDTRRRLGLVTYYKYKEEMRRDDRIALLTEFGVYRTIINSRSAYAAEFKKHIYTVIKNARLTEREKLNVINSDDLKTLKERLETLEKTQADYTKYNPAIYVFRREINDNPYKYITGADPEIARDYDESYEYLYKFTTKPNSTDYTESQLHAKIYGDSSQIMDELIDGSLETLPVEFVHNRYHTSFDFDVSGKVVFE